MKWKPNLLGFLLSYAVKSYSRRVLLLVNEIRIEKSGFPSLFKSKAHSVACCSGVRLMSMGSKFARFASCIVCANGSAGTLQVPVVVHRASGLTSRPLTSQYLVCDW